MLEEIEQLEHELTGIDGQLKKTPSHLELGQGARERKVPALAPSRKQLVDTVRNDRLSGRDDAGINRAEELARTDDARSLLRVICFCSEADLTP